jgi:hypothetical protein
MANLAYPTPTEPESQDSEAEGGDMADFESWLAKSLLGEQEMDVVDPVTKRLLMALLAESDQMGSMGM